VSSSFGALCWEPVTGERVWTELERRERAIAWLARHAKMKPKRLYNLKYGTRAGTYFWRADEAAAVSRVLGLSLRTLFGRRARFGPPCRCRCGRCVARLRKLEARETEVGAAA
jgi:hypothetical protein